MTFTLTIDADRWISRINRTITDIQSAGAGVVPVIKGNGYGVGQRQLANVAGYLGTTTIAVGTMAEALEMLSIFEGEVLVLQPVSPADPILRKYWNALAQSRLNARLITTISDRAGLEYFLDHTVGGFFVLELATSLKRFGFSADELRTVWQQLTPRLNAGHAVLRGISAHLPMNPTAADVDAIAEAFASVSDSGDRFMDAGTLWVSHCSTAQLARLAKQFPHAQIGLRTGTGLWLGDRSLIKARGLVLNAVSINRGQRAGYAQRKITAPGYVVTVAGGTSHGVGLSAPATIRSLRDRVVAIAKGVEQASGRMRSPFSLNGAPLDFVDAPHQQVSLVFVPAHLGPVTAGQYLDCEVRFTITRADAVYGLESLQPMTTDDVLPATNPDDLPPAQNERE